MILEAAILNVIEGQTEDFEAAFKVAAPIIASAHGYVSHTLQHCIETPNRYILLIHWETLDDHLVGFRQSEAFQEWKRLLHHFYSPMPTVQHFEPIANL